MNRPIAENALQRLAKIVECTDRDVLLNTFKRLAGDSQEEMGNICVLIREEFKKKHKHDEYAEIPLVPVVESQNQELAGCVRCNEPTKHQCHYHPGNPIWDGSDFHEAPHAVDVLGIRDNAPDLTLWTCCGRNAHAIGCRVAIHHQFAGEAEARRHLESKFSKVRENHLAQVAAAKKAAKKAERLAAKEAAKLAAASIPEERQLRSGQGRQSATSQAKPGRRGGKSTAPPTTVAQPTQGTARDDWYHSEPSSPASSTHEVPAMDHSGDAKHHETHDLPESSSRPATTAAAKTVVTKRKREDEGDSEATAQPELRHSKRIKTRSVRAPVPEQLESDERKARAPARSGGTARATPAEDHGTMRGRTNRSKAKSMPTTVPAPAQVIPSVEEDEEAAPEPETSSATQQKSVPSGRSKFPDTWADAAAADVELVRRFKAGDDRGSIWQDYKRSSGKVISKPGCMTRAKNLMDRFGL